MSVHTFPGHRVTPTALRVEAAERWYDVVQYAGRQRRPLGRFLDRTTAEFCAAALAKRDGLTLQPEAEF